jgi:hypothetical protein
VLILRARQSVQQGVFAPTTSCRIDRGTNCCSSNVFVGAGPGGGQTQCDVFVLDIATNADSNVQLCLIEQTQSGFRSSLYIADDSNPAVDCSLLGGCTGGVRHSDDGTGRCAAVAGRSSNYPLRLHVGRVRYEISSPFDYVVGESYQFSHVQNYPCSGC